jgi:hypothetical protein
VTDLLIIVPTRSRPESVLRVVQAWVDTGAFDDGAALSFVFDVDDPRADDYRDALSPPLPMMVRALSMPTWKPLVPKLNTAAELYADNFRDIGALGFAGDDHLPRTKGWARRYIDELRKPGTGIVYCDDGYQHENIPTQWAMRADIVRALGGMVPAPVEHLYCDNAVRDLGYAVGCLAYLGDVLIEHMHPSAGKAATDAQYDRVNSRQQFRGDRAAYRHWRDNGGLTEAARLVDTVMRGGGIR